VVPRNAPCASGVGEHSSAGLSGLDAAPSEEPQGYSADRFGTAGELSWHADPAPVSKVESVWVTRPGEFLNTPFEDADSRGSRHHRARQSL